MLRRSLLPGAALVAGLALTAVACGGSTETSTSPTTAAGADQPAGGDAPASTTSTSEATTTTVDPGSLPQTEDRPSSDSPAFEARVQALWDGIVADDPELALPMFFPLAAYEQVKDMSDPASDYANRLMTQYAGDIHAYHAQLGDDADKATLVGMTVPDYNTQWINPGIEYNVIGYWRVLDSTLTYEVDGVEQSFNVKSMISWRGEWYVVHLIAIK